MTKPRIRKRGKWWFCGCTKAYTSALSWQEAYQKWWHLVNTYQ